MLLADAALEIAIREIRSHQPPVDISDARDQSRDLRLAADRPEAAARQAKLIALVVLPPPPLMVETAMMRMMDGTDGTVTCVRHSKEPVPKRSIA